MQRQVIRSLLAGMVALLVSACEVIQSLQTPAVAQWVPRVAASYPHDANAWTQGLFWHEGTLYESVGLYGQSDLRQVRYETGEVLRRTKLADRFFAEGITLVSDRIIMLTWLEKVAFVYDLATFSQISSFSYEGEGWGLCYDGSVLYMSNGSTDITVRDGRTFKALRSYTVTQDGKPVSRLNELECVGNDIYANIWNTDTIVRFNRFTGQVNAAINTAGLLTPSELAQVQSRGGILNGIAFHPPTGRYFITGKFWPRLFEVEFVPAPVQ